MASVRASSFVILRYLPLEGGRAVTRRPIGAAVVVTFVPLRFLRPFPFRSMKLGK